MNLVIEGGNTRIKYGVISNNKLIDTFIASEFDIYDIQILQQKHSLKYCILSSTRNIRQEFENNLKDLFPNFLHFNNQTPLPIQNLYTTPETVGLDRLANVVGANNIQPDKNVLIIDTGTAITYDIINKDKDYLGGDITPGMKVRFRALNDYTDKLPLIDKFYHIKPFANKTSEAIISGVINGILYEMNGYISDFKHKFNNNYVFLTGGDAEFFAKKLKNRIFVNLNLNLTGLNRILDHNAK